MEFNFTFMFLPRNELFLGSTLCQPQPATSLVQEESVWAMSLEKDEAF